MTNAKLADHFDLLSKLMDIHGENPFKTKTYSIAAFTLERLPKEVSAMTEDEFYQIKGFGDAIISKIKELQSTGTLSVLEQTIAATPQGVLEMMHIKGLGPKKIAVIWKEMGIETLGELEYACTENRLAAIKGFGQKTQDKICEAIAFFQQSQGLHLYAQVINTAEQLVTDLKKSFPNAKVSLTGAIRRQEVTIGSIEIITDVQVEELRQFFAMIPDGTIEEQEGQIAVKIEGKPDIICYTASTKQFYSRLFITTASDEFTVAFKESGTVAEDAESEEEIFATTEHKLIIPAPLRSTKHWLSNGTKEIPTLIEPKDIKGIIHSHSTYSDGAYSLEEMATAAKKSGYEYLVISDHSQAAYYANGLKPERIVEQHKEIEELNTKLAPFKIFKSIEADILGDGALDYDAKVLASFDLVIASVHSNLQMSAEKAMDRVLAAVRNPFTRILGHPTGRLLLSRGGYPIDHKVLIDTCAAYDVVIEINANPRRLDIDWKWIPYAMEKGVLLSINPDAHSIKGMGDVAYGVFAAQKGGLTAKANLSSMSLIEFEDWLKSKSIPGKEI